MWTVIIVILAVALGFAVLIAFILRTRHGGRRTSARVELVFTVGWLFAAMASAVIRVTIAGRAWPDELLLAAIIFAIPATPAMIIWVKNHKAVGR